MADLQQKLETIRREEIEKETQAQAQEVGLPYLDLTFKPIDPEALALIPEEEAREAEIVCIQKKAMSLILVLVNPKNPKTEDLIEKLRERGFVTNPHLVSRPSLQRALEDYKKVGPKEEHKISGLITISVEKLKILEGQIKTLDSLAEKVKSIPSGEIGETLEMILTGALKNNASDVHFEKEEEGSRLRFRLDGLLYDIVKLGLKTHEFLLSRIKILAELKLNVHDRAQDGRFSVLRGENTIEIRVSTLPSEYGESIVLRILNPKSLISVEDLGLRLDLKEILEKELTRPNGMILVTGPTGSGKTTTLYAFLKKLSNPGIKIITIEDPVEYHLEGIDQTQVKPEKGYGFANALRSVLRQDPDVILVGEIRDKETANIAVQASLTGHLVFSTLHTNEAAGTIPRLVDLGIKPTTIGPSLNLAIAQRLLRKVCKNCATLFKPDAEILEKIKKNLANLPRPLKREPKEAAFYRANGCDKCHRSGYKDRTAIFEFLIIDKEAEKFIAGAPSFAEIQDFAIKQGMVTTQQDGLLKVMEGLTTLEELERVTGKL